MKDASELKPFMINAGIKFKGLRAIFIYDDYNVTTQDGGYEVLLKDYDMKCKIITGEIKYDIKLGDKFSLTPKFNFVSSQPWKSAEHPLDGENVSYYRYDRTVNRYKGGIMASYDPTEKINILGGVDYNMDYATDNIKEWPFLNGEYKIDYSNFAGFLQSIIKTKIVNMTIGGRIENHSQYGVAFAPRIGITKIINDFHFKLLYNQAFRSPTIEEIDYNSAFDPINFEPTIKPEKTQVMELELGYNFTKNMALTANVYYIGIDDAILWISNTAGIGGYNNLGKTGTWGFDFDYRIRQNWGYIYLNYSHHTPKDINKIDVYAVPNVDNYMLGSPSDKINLKSNFNITENLSIGPSMTFYGKRYAYTSYDSNTWENVLSEYDPSVLLNLYISYRNLFVEGLTLGVGAYNILNTKYDFLEAYDNFHNAIPSQDFEFIAKLTYHFQFK